MSRVSFYIDGYNFYCGLRDKYGRKWNWLDYGQMCRRILKPGQRLTDIHYCTAPVKGGTDKTRRQEDYWKALSTIPEMTIHKGYHQKNKKRCYQCKNIVSKYEEKQTDSRIAALLVADALLRRVDVQVLIAGDSDHVPAIEVVKQECPGTIVLVCWPPDRKSNALEVAADSDFAISRQMIKNSQFPDTIVLPTGDSVSRPVHWH